MTLAMATTTRAAQTVALVRMIGGKRRRRKIPRAVWPHATEREYAAKMSAIMTRASAAFVPLVIALPRFVAMAKASQPFGVAVRNAVESSYRTMMASLNVDVIAGLARRYGRQVSQHTRTQFQRQAKAALGIDVTITDGRDVAASISRFVDLSVSHVMAIPETMTTDIEKRIVRMLSLGPRLDALGAKKPEVIARPSQGVENVRLIVNRPEKFEEQQIANAVERNIFLGGSTAELAEELEKRFGFFKEHAAFIARDQVGKLNGQATADRQQGLGLTKFIWRSVGDADVREEHDDRDGEEYEYADPPDGELPGEPINCRCSAEPVFDELLDALDE